MEANMAKALELLQALASKMGTTSEYLWGVLIRQAPIAAMTNIVFYLFGALFTWITLCLYKRYRDPEYIDSPALAIAVVAAMIGVVTMIGFLATLGDTIAGLVNPEYWALNRVLTMIRGGNCGQ